MKIKIAFLLSLLMVCRGAFAQELRAKVTVNASQVQTTETAVFDNLQQAIEQFVNTRQWTHLQFRENERIVCNFNITVQQYDRESNHFSCKALIQANRPCIMPVTRRFYTTTPITILISTTHSSTSWS